MRRLEDRVALVTGAASGIGLATSRRLADEGAIVVLTDIADEPGKQAAADITDAGGRATYVHLDVTREVDWLAALAGVAGEHGRLDVLVNNAGVGDILTLEETPLESYERTIAIVQTSVFLGMKSAADLLKASAVASVINISSIYGVSGGFGTSPGYHAGKGSGATADEEHRDSLGPGWHPRELRASRVRRHTDSSRRRGPRSSRRSWISPPWADWEGRKRSPPWWPSSPAMMRRS